MATKGERTRQRIVEHAAPIFNRLGYSGSSMSDLMHATGLGKGGLYNHFNSKDELALAAFERNTGVVADMIAAGLKGKRHALERLLALVGVYRDFADSPPIPGGCPMLNTSVEADDAYPALRTRTREVMDDLRLGTVARIIERGIERGEVRDDIDPEDVAGVIVASVEGGLMLSQLYGDPAHLHRVADHLESYVLGLGATPEGRGDGQPA